MIKLLGPVKSFTTIRCKEGQPTLSVIAPLLVKFFESFPSCRERWHFDTINERNYGKRAGTSLCGCAVSLTQSICLRPRCKKANLFCTVNPSQRIKTSRELAFADIFKYKEMSSLRLGGNLLSGGKLSFFWQKLSRYIYAFLVLVYLLNEFLALQMTLSNLNVVSCHLNM